MLGLVFQRLFRVKIESRLVAHKRSKFVSLVCLYLVLVYSLFLYASFSKKLVSVFLIQMRLYASLGIVCRNGMVLLDPTVTISDTHAICQSSHMNNRSANCTFLSRCNYLRWTCFYYRNFPLPTYR